MSLHAGFAAALSFTGGALQGFLHAAYVNKRIPGRLKGHSQVFGVADIAYDFSMAEPQIELVAGVQGVTLHFDLLGSATFTGSGKPAVTTQLRIKATALGAVLAVPIPDFGGAIQFGVDSSGMAISDYSVKMVGGDDPTPVYGFSPGNALTATVALQAIAAGSSHLALTPPQLAHFVKLKYTLKLAVRASADSLNIGVDVDGLTTGTPAQLVDLNRLVGAKGWKKTLYQSVHVADDEYGEPIYEQQWGTTKHRVSGAHNTAVAVALNETVFQDIYRRFGRHRVFAYFETLKYLDVVARIAPLEGKFPVTAYEPSDLELTALDGLDIAFHTDYLQITGTGSNYSVIPAHADFSLKTRIVRTYFDGDTQFLMSYKYADGFNAESYDVNVSDPDWVTGIMVLALFTGINLIPHSGAVMLAVAAVEETLLATLVGSLIGAEQDELTPAVLDSMTGFHSALQYKLPHTTYPKFSIRCEDVLVRPENATAWFTLTTEASPARIYIKTAPQSTGTGSIEQAQWSAVTLDPIVIKFTSGGALYNPDDTRVRIKWQVHGNQIGILLLDTDVPIGDAGATQISIDHAANAYQAYKKFIVRCRVYRPWDNQTDELFKQELDITILDKLDRTHPYVHWNHTVFYQGYSAKEGNPAREPLGWQTVSRKSHIHYTNAAKRCRFADAFSPDTEPVYLDTLPFPIGLADQHRDLVCPYCFFGGPDKHVLK
jgi:hypothetical protein